MIKIGDTLILESRNEKEVHEYKSKVVEIFPDLIHIDYPVNKKTGKTVYLINGMQFKASFVGKDECLYLFDTEVKGKVRDPIPMIVLSYPGDDQLVRIQRRQYVRVEANVDIAIHPLHGEFLPFATMTTDISAGGAAIVLPERAATILPGTVVEAWLVLHMKSGDYHYIKVPAKIVRIFQAEGSHVYKASLQFLTMEPKERVLLIRYSFERQLEMRKKEEGIQE
ncbi:c-di-GMP-binding flagellar brake protein YcgR [Anoxybacillus tepidamans]|uniref:C-di-GMP-binding flagellar brake protein YcgR n=1 Tax=Anoxybacteroides tepidamans TaxID=265948 RepID=A0A7W8IP40_9BACL|nr:flagellar brake domain-containing protein [Anoxybacillus tepidamans]MBB5323431.1 c-di-GMP-binding flagellar brake protein YcgR [Anoxybacillus tepidamans]